MATLATFNEGPIEIHYEERGEGDALVLIGGLTSTLQVWGLMVPELAKHYRVISPDNRGSGSTRVEDDDGVRTPARFAGDVLALLDGLGLERVHLFGASMGGLIVQEFALRYPQRLATLIIACSTVGGTRSVRVPDEVLKKLFQGSGEGAPEAESQAVLEILVHPETPIKRPANFRFFVDTRQRYPHSNEELARRAAGIVTFDAYQRLGELAVPTLVLTGSDDALIPKQNAKILADRIPNAELVEIADAGHVFFAEQPEATNRALLDFLRRHPR